jgi:hypothetical protein
MGFSELIKNFDKIRDYARDFLIYGYKCRNDYNKKSGRSYDNERRRIESYLRGYIHWETSLRGKNLFNSTDTGDVSENPLFSVWETKSFTTNDCLLHFCLFDILIDHPGITAREATDLLADEYFGCFNEQALPDAMTVRNKLNEYAELGLFYKEKHGKALCYFWENTPLDQGLPSLLENFSTAAHFFENVVPAGVLGYFIRKKCGHNTNAFSFRHLFTSHTLDDDVMLYLVTAISEKRLVQIDSCSSRAKVSTKKTILPLKIAVNVKHGRRYLLAYNYQRHNFFSYRLDYIHKVELLAKCPIFHIHLASLEERLSTTWGAFLGKHNHLELLEMTLYIDEKAESYVLNRLKREGKHGTVEKLAENTFLYRIEVTETQEMVPWLRTFIGRIIALQGTNTRVITEFLDDINRMAALYHIE